MTPEELAVAYHKDARNITKYVWNLVVARLPAWMRDDWEGVADEALWEAARNYTPATAEFSTFLYGVVRRHVWDTLRWSRSKKRRPTVSVGPLVKELAAPPEPELDPVDDLTGTVWSTAMDREPHAVHTRYRLGEQVSELQRQRLKRLIQQLRADFYRRYEESL